MGLSKDLKIQWPCRMVLISFLNGQISGRCLLTKTNATLLDFVDLKALAIIFNYKLGETMLTSVSHHPYFSVDFLHLLTGKFMLLTLLAMQTNH